MGNYWELSVWEDYLDGGKFEERRVMVIGGSDMQYQGGAFSPNLKRNVNGSKDLTFKMYYRFVDTITGEEVDNPFVAKLNNETKVKLNRDGTWYDFIIKGVSKNSQDKSYTYTAADQHVIELSKNGFGLTLDTQLENNIGTVQELGAAIFKGTGWTVEAEGVPQTLEEALVEIKLDKAVKLDKNAENPVYRFYKMIDKKSGLPDEDYVTPKRDESNPEDTDTYSFIFPANSTIYGFYSSLTSQPDRFQFIFSTGTLEKNSNRIITSNGVQYYVETNNGLTYAKENKSGCDFFIPTFLEPDSIESIKISSAYRGKRYVFSRKVLYNSVLDKYVTEFKDNEGNTWHEYQESEFVAPILIENLVTNNTFTSTSGWTGHYVVPQELTTYDEDTQKYTDGYINKLSTYGVKRDIATSPDIQSHILSGSYNPEEITYTAYLSATFPALGETSDPRGILINSGFSDRKTKIENLSPSQKFVLVYKLLDSSNIKDFEVSIGEWEYNVGDNRYINKGNIYLTFHTKAAVEVEGKDGYYYIVGTVDSGYNLSKIEFQGKRFQIYIDALYHYQDDTYDYTGGELRLQDFQIFEYIDKSGTFMFPEDAETEAKEKITYCYFNPNTEQNKNASKVNEMAIYKYPQRKSSLRPSYTAGAEKSITLSIKESNYFNAAQSLCEKAECWVDFIVGHDDNGSITTKTVKFLNYIGQDNNTGIRYGVNLNSIARNLDSKSFVSKLIVPDNTNEHANNGFCTIARGKSNNTKETYIYDFTYYINQGLLDYNTLMHTLYYGIGDVEGQETASGPDISAWDTATQNWKPEANWTEWQDDLDNGNCNGYYIRLARLNNTIDELGTEIASFTVPLTKAQADVQTYKSGELAAREGYETAASDFIHVTGFSYREINTTAREDMAKNNSTAASYLAAIITNEQNQKDFADKLASAEQKKEAYETRVKELTAKRDKLIKMKEGLNNCFFQQYNRFIQEGTWKDDAEIDDEKYFINAQSVAYTSSQPQVSYSINALELSALPGYEHFKLSLGDQTFVEDEEFFGVDSDGNLIREEVVITEISETLDDPTQTQVTVQNYKNQFQDLFQKITASVQSVSYASGAWDNAGKLASGDAARKSAFLEEALSDVDTVIQNAGNQSVLEDDQGITITDLTLPNQQVRITGGAVLLSDVDEGGNQKWRVGITAKGINASTITAGQINTGNIQIMNGNDPTFLWDAYGITAYDFNETIEEGAVVSTNYNYRKGVRYDRFGLYGFSDKAPGWHPTKLDEVSKNADFGLTWDGVFFNLGKGTYKHNATNIVHGSGARLGKVDNSIFNAWSSENVPYYNEEDTTSPTFVKVFSAGTSTGGDDYSENLVIYDNGTLVSNDIYLTGSVQWTAASSPSKSVYGPIGQERLPNNNVHYNQFPPNKPTSDEDIAAAETKGTYLWHTVVSDDDVFYAHTDDGGATWQGPFLITGRSITGQEIKYATAVAGTDWIKIDETEWKLDYPSIIPVGYNVYTRIKDEYSDGNLSSGRYDITLGPRGEVRLSQYASSIVATPEGEITQNQLPGLTTIKVTIWDDNGEPVNISDDFEINWTPENGVIKKIVRSGETVQYQDIGTDKQATEVCLVSMSNNVESASITATVRRGTVQIGQPRTFIITKSRQGQNGSVIQCYITSSEGMAFESSENDTTTLTAWVLQDGKEITDTDNWTYQWYFEKGADDGDPIGSGKTITFNKSFLRGMRVYFIVEPKSTTD